METQVFALHELKVGMRYKLIRNGLIELFGDLVRTTPEFATFKFTEIPEDSRFFSFYEPGRMITFKQPFTDYIIFEQEIIPAMPAPKAKKRNRRK